MMREAIYLDNKRYLQVAQSPMDHLSLESNIYDELRNWRIAPKNILGVNSSTKKNEGVWTNGFRPRYLNIHNCPSLSLSQKKKKNCRENWGKKKKKRDTAKRRKHDIKRKVNQPKPSASSTFSNLFQPTCPKSPITRSSSPTKPDS
ncbi:hypothetical protein I7I48_08465 [Histoplasma ohiense]|nr:hypothetical protein I7I48_08465 [Histoplasma ohiense (nom. inval.)]